MDSTIQPQNEFYTPETGVVSGAESQVAQAGQDISAENPFPNVQPSEILTNKMATEVVQPQSELPTESDDELAKEIIAGPDLKVVPDPQEISIDSSYAAKIPEVTPVPAEPTPIETFQPEIVAETTKKEEEVTEEPETILSEIDESFEAINEKIAEYLNANREKITSLENSIKEAEDRLENTRIETEQNIKEKKAEIVELRKMRDRISAYKERTKIAKNPTELAA